MTRSVARSVGLVFGACALLSATGSLAADATPPSESSSVPSHVAPSEATPPPPRSGPTCGDGLDRAQCSPVGGEFVASFGYWGGSIGSDEFAAWGVRRTTGSVLRVAAPGREFGFARPPMFEMALDVRVSIRTFFALGAHLSYVGAGTPDSEMTSTSRGRSYLAAEPVMHGFTFAGEAQGILPLGPVLVRLGVLVGIRGQYLHIPTLVAGECSYTDAMGAAQTADCDDHASAFQFVLQPRAYVDYAVRPYFAVGIYAGVDAFSDMGVAAGVTLAYRTKTFTDPGALLVQRR